MSSIETGIGQGIGQSIGQAIATDLTSNPQAPTSDMSSDVQRVGHAAYDATSTYGRIRSTMIAIAAVVVMLIMFAVGASTGGGAGWAVAGIGLAVGAIGAAQAYFAYKYKSYAAIEGTEDIANAARQVL